MAWNWFAPQVCSVSLDWQLLLRLLLRSNDEKWRHRRRLITPSFHDTRLLHSFIDIFNEQSSILVQRFHQLIKQTNQIDDFQSYITACTLDIIAGLPISLERQSIF